MSRFVQILSAHDEAISPQGLRVMLRDMVQKLEATSGYIDEVPYFSTSGAVPASKSRWTMKLAHR